MRNYGNQTVLYQSFNKQLPMVCPGDGAVEETQTQSVLVGSTVNSLLVGDRALVLIWLKFFYYGVKKSVWEKNEHVKIYYESDFFFWPPTGSLLPNVFKSHAWGILHTLLEMFSYRLHHIQPHYRVTLLSHLHSLAVVPHTNQNQLHLW